MCALPPLFAKEGGEFDTLSKGKLDEKTIC
jgi:hypothetical protein